MRKRSLFSALVLSCGIWAKTQAGTIPRILVTGFEPYFHKTNASFEIAKRIIAEEIRAAGTEGYVAPYTLSLCPAVPNSFETAATHVQKCVDEFRPDYVISLGESPECAIRMETHAANWYGNAANMYSSTELFRKQIEPGAPLWLELSLPLETLYSTYKDHYGDGGRLKLRVGNSDKNYFTCNKLAYDMQKSLTSQKTLYGFIHVPNFECSSYYLTKKRFLKDMSEKLRYLMRGLNSQLAIHSDRYQADFDRESEKSFIKGDESLQATMKVWLD